MDILITTSTHSRNEAELRKESQRDYQFITHTGEKSNGLFNFSRREF